MVESTNFSIQSADCGEFPPRHDVIEQPRFLAPLTTGAATMFGATRISSHLAHRNPAVWQQGLRFAVSVAVLSIGVRNFMVETVVFRACSATQLALHTGRWFNNRTLRRAACSLLVVNFIRLLDQRKRERFHGEKLSRIICEALKFSFVEIEIRFWQTRILVVLLRIVLFTEDFDYTPHNKFRVLVCSSNQTILRSS